MSIRATAVYLLLFLASLLTLQGCLKAENLRPATNVVLLQYEYETVRDQFRDAELTVEERLEFCLLYTSPIPRDQRGARMPSSA